MRKKRTKKKKKTKKITKKINEFKELNSVKPIWTRPESEITNEEYIVFIKAFQMISKTH